MSIGDKRLDNWGIEWVIVGIAPNVGLLTIERLSLADVRLPKTHYCVTVRIPKQKTIFSWQWVDGDW